MIDEQVKTFGNPPIPVADVVDEDGNTYCQVHTDVGTGLRCNNCERLMCAKCAVHTPVGYRCVQCTRQQEDRFFNADQSYYLKIAAICVVLGGIGAYIAGFIGFFLFVFFIGAVAGGIISETVMRYTKGKRGRYSGEVAAAGVVVGALLVVIFLYTQIKPSPEVLALWRQQYDEATINHAIAEMRPGFFAFLTRQFDIIIYAIITAVTVYGRFNIYGRKR